MNRKVAPPNTGPISGHASSSTAHSASGSGRRLAQAQGVFYVLTGIWPLLHLPSFIAVTGPKTDLWLVQTVGALIAVVGAAVWAAARRREVVGEIVFLAAGSAGALAAVDVVFVLRDVILPIYLADAVVELGLVTAWLLVWARRKRPPGAAPKA